MNCDYVRENRQKPFVLLAKMNHKLESHCASNRPRAVFTLQLFSLELVQMFIPYSDMDEMEE